MREYFKFIVESFLFVVDSYGGIGWEVKVCKFRDRIIVFYVSGIVIGVKDIINFYFSVGVCRGNEGVGGIVDKSS